MKGDSKCNICPRQCSVDRNLTCGVCGVGNTMRVAYVGLHQWEEPIISGVNGSGTIFFSGCNLKCCYCQNYEVSHYGKGFDITKHELVEYFKRLEGEGAHNINLVTANHYLLEIFRALDMYKPKIPICYNTSSYDSLEMIAMASDYIDVFLADIKYANSELAGKLSGASDYVEVATNAIKLMRAKKTDDVIDGIMREGLIVRHLVLPNYIPNSLAVMQWISDNMPKESYISVMSQFTPIVLTEENLSRKLKPLEYKIVVEKLYKDGFYNSFIQETCSSGTEYIPNFDGVSFNQFK